MLELVKGEGLNAFRVDRLRMRTSLARGRGQIKTTAYLVVFLDLTHA